MVAIININLQLDVLHEKQKQLKNQEFSNQKVQASNKFNKLQKEIASLAQMKDDFIYRIGDMHANLLLDEDRQVLQSL